MARSSVILAFAALVLAGCGGESSVDNPAQMRFFDAYSDQSNIRLTVGGRLYRSGNVGPSIENGDLANYSDVPSGTVELVAKTYDGFTTLATTSNQRLVRDQFYTAVAMSVGGTKRITVYGDTSVRTDNAAAFRVINAYSNSNSTTTSPVFLRLFRSSDNALVYATSTVGSAGLATGATTNYQSVTEENADGSDYTLRVYDASDFSSELASRTVTLKTGEPVTFFLYNRRSSNDMLIKSGIDRSSNG